MKKPTAEHMINENIPFQKVFVVGANGEKVGVLSTREAIEMAKEQRLDLVLISVQPKPIARILDYGKFKYERKKKQKAAKEKQTVIQNRQIRLTPLIGEHDLNVKARKAKEFLLDGDRIKVSLKFRGRESARPELGHKTLEKFYKAVEDLADIAKEAELVNDRFLDMYLQPNKIKVNKYRKEHNLVDKNSDSQDKCASEEDTNEGEQ
ncbi:translation initiation factor IF-3 (plasmid) [Mesomycoplasma conjunctivae]|nr:translation initiation factor IF-3 [Mycoplasmopsis fermentans]ADN68930.1 translation initiation factor IF-3 [Mycoplasmopsis fermentans JER]ADV34354.1 Translation initiation factor IF-3 [Mycoplasmopsis fermentans M64]VEU60377.1 translation initiation factor IF-3 [Mycoplasmopsis fermentans]VEU67519.1 translation initiation factor IF-3 [Mesomycoplasma conjunctivae]